MLILITVRFLRSDGCKSSSLESRFPSNGGQRGAFSIGMTSTESGLLQQAKDGSDEAFCQILRLHQARVRGYLHRFLTDRDTIEDLAQDTFLTAYRKLGAYTGEAPFALWLLRIAKNHVLSYLRDEGRRRTHEEAAGFEQALRGILIGQAESEDPETEGDDRQLSALRGCVKKLPEHSAALVAEYYFKKRSTAEIAREIQKQQGAVWIALLRIRRALASCIQSRLAASEANA